jgi:hypothetical protein
MLMARSLAHEYASFLSEGKSFGKLYRCSVTGY